jgi:hypothetical protein
MVETPAMKSLDSSAPPGIARNPRPRFPYRVPVPTHHACHTCGHDLSRLRALADPHYALPVVTCSACRTSTVRRRDPSVAGYRCARRVVRALLTIFVQSLVVSLAITAAVALISNIAYTAHWEHKGNPLTTLLLRAHELRPDASGPMLGVLTAAMLLLGLFTGAWSRSALHHLDTGWTLLGGAGLPTLLALSPALMFWGWVRLGQPGNTPWGDPAHIQYWPGTMTAGVMYAAFIAAGMPLGRTVRAAWAANWKSRRSKYRRARRRLREDR